jgi:hypothetical protein
MKEQEVISSGLEQVLHELSHIGTDRVWKGTLSLYLYIPSEDVPCAEFMTKHYDDYTVSFRFEGRTIKINDVTDVMYIDVYSLDSIRGRKD